MLSIVVVLTCAVLANAGPLPGNDVYGPIEEYIQGAVKSDDLAENFEAAGSLIYNPKVDPVTRRAADIFVGLEHNMTRCNDEAADIVMANKVMIYSMVGYQPIQPDTSSRRVNKIIDEAIKTHAKTCLPQYVEKLEQRDADLEPEVRQAMHSYVESHLAKLDGSNVEKLKKFYRTFNPRDQECEAIKDKIYLPCRDLTQGFKASKMIYDIEANEEYNLVDVDPKLFTLMATHKLCSGAL